MQVCFLWICVSLNHVPTSFPALMNVSSLGAERNRRHFYCIPKNGKYHFVGLFFIHLGAVRLTATDASLDICKGGTFWELEAADTLCPAARGNRNRPDVLYLFSFLSCSSVAADFFPGSEVSSASKLVWVSHSPQRALPWVGWKVCKGSTRWLGSSCPWEQQCPPRSPAAGCASGGSGGDSPPAPREGRETSRAPRAVGLASEKPGALAAP